MRKPKEKRKRKKLPPRMTLEEARIAYWRREFAGHKADVERLMGLIAERRRKVYGG